MIEPFLFLSFPVAVGVLAQVGFRRTGATWAGASLALSLWLVDAVSAGLLRAAWSAPDRIRASRDAYRALYAMADGVWERIEFIAGTAGLSALLITAILVTLPKRT